MAARRIKMSDAVTAKLLDLAKRARGSVKVGFIDSDQAPIAFWNEFGHKGRFPAPPRPFFRTMVANESPRWPAMMASQLRATKLDGQRTLAYMGEEIDGALKQSIIETNTPPLSKTTLRLRYKFKNHPENIRARDVVAAQEELARNATPTKRGKPRKALALASGTQAKPLIWTGQMLNSTEYQVSNGDIMRLNTKTKEYEARA
ncbi:MAG: hypothetical protein ACYCOU_01865 [Sulfobacillus sp.]